MCPLRSTHECCGFRNSRKAYKERRDQYNLNITARNRYYDKVDKVRRIKDRLSSVSISSGVQVGEAMVGGPSGSGFMYEDLAMKDLIRVPVTAQKRKANIAINQRGSKRFKLDWRLAFMDREDLLSG